VLLLDSDAHTYEYVIHMLRTLFAHTLEEAFELARTVDTRGSAIVCTTHRELAELRVEQIHGFGADPIMGDRCAGPMRALLRIAEDASE
jgi:ATP-dependent Clp protease adaptor protein ClpS